MKVVKAQKGFQVDFLSSPADILVGGSGAGVGKTRALLIEGMRHQHNPEYKGIIFRRTTPMIKNPGAIWDQSETLYNLIGGAAQKHSLDWRFKSGARLKFSHLEHEKNKYDHQGAEYAFVGFDEGTHFTFSQFLYILSRNRSVAGIKPYVRITCNPDPDHWLADFISWWIGEDGYPIPEREGMLRYMTVYQDKIIWGASAQEVIDLCPWLVEQAATIGCSPDFLVKSVSFISGKIEDNKKLMEANPGYLGTLNALSAEEQLRLKGGNWKVKSTKLGLGLNEAIENIRHNKVPSGRRAITCDAARYGRNLAVIKVWDGMRVICTHIRTKCDTAQLAEEIQKHAVNYQVNASDIIVDEDGIGGGVLDHAKSKGYGSWYGFRGGGVPINRENYKDLKTQCAYRFFEEYVNTGKFQEEPVYFVDGVQTNEVLVKTEPVNLIAYTKKQLRTFRRVELKSQYEKKRMIPKEEQKALLNGESPDLGDSLLMIMVSKIDHNDGGLMTLDDDDDDLLGVF